MHSTCDDTCVRQGITTGHPLRLMLHVKRLISIDPNNPINPDRDVCESGEFNLQVSHSDEHMAEIYAPNVKFLGNILRSRLAVLQRAFMQAAVTNPGKAEQPTESHFAEAIAQLLVRYCYTAGMYRKDMEHVEMP